jgi:FtsZ-binding cell division protein ZapB
MKKKIGRPTTLETLQKEIEALKHDNGRLVQQSANLATDNDLLKRRIATIMSANSELRAIIKKVTAELVPYTTGIV